MFISESKIYSINKIENVFDERGCQCTSSAIIW